MTFLGKKKEKKKDIYLFITNCLTWYHPVELVFQPNHVGIVSVAFSPRKLIEKIAQYVRWGGFFFFLTVLPRSVSLFSAFVFSCVAHIRGCTSYTFRDVHTSNMFEDVQTTCSRVYKLHVQGCTNYLLGMYRLHVRGCRDSGCTWYIFRNVQDTHSGMYKGHIQGCTMYIFRDIHTTYLGTYTRYIFQDVQDTYSGMYKLHVQGCTS